jgi:hypothetical protein
MCDTQHGRESIMSSVQLINLMWQKMVKAWYMVYGHHTNVRISCKHNPVNEDTMLRLVRNLYLQWVIIL